MTIKLLQIRIEWLRIFKVIELIRELGGASLGKASRGKYISFQYKGWGYSFDLLAVKKTLSLYTLVDFVPYSCSKNHRLS